MFSVDSESLTVVSIDLRGGLNNMEYLSAFAVANDGIVR